jgi:hypothetical protein
MSCFYYASRWADGHGCRRYSTRVSSRPLPSSAPARHAHRTSLVCGAPSFHLTDVGVFLGVASPRQDLNSRVRLCEYAESQGIDVPGAKRNEAPFSTDANLLHISYEGNALEDPWVAPDESMFTRSVSPEQAPDTPTIVEIEFEKGDPVAVDGVKMSPATLLTKCDLTRPLLLRPGCLYSRVTHTLAHAR